MLTDKILIEYKAMVKMHSGSVVNYKMYTFLKIHILYKGFGFNRKIKKNDVEKYIKNRRELRINNLNIKYILKNGYHLSS